MMHVGNRFFKITIGSCKFMQLPGAFLYSCNFVHLFTLKFLVVPPALSYTHRIAAYSDGPQQLSGDFILFGTCQPLLEV